MLVADALGLGVNSFGAPLLEINDCALDPKLTTSWTIAFVATGKTASTPDATAVMNVSVATNFRIVWSCGGQLTKPVVKHSIPVYVTFLLSVVVVSSS